MVTYTASLTQLAQAMTKEAEGATGCSADTDMTALYEPHCSLTSCASQADFPDMCWRGSAFGRSCHDGYI
jgi:hypothetical protein